MSRMKTAAALAAVVALAVASVAQADLVMAYSMNRHGARNFLPKGPTLNEADSNGGPTLLPEGQRMCYNAGESGICLGLDVEVVSPRQSARAALLCSKFSMTDASRCGETRGGSPPGVLATCTCSCGSFTPYLNVWARVLPPRHSYHSVTHVCKQLCAGSQPWRQPRLAMPPILVT